MAQQEDPPWPLMVVVAFIALVCVGGWLACRWVRRTAEGVTFDRADLGWWLTTGLTALAGLGLIVGVAFYYAAG